MMHSLAKPNLLLTRIKYQTYNGREQQSSIHQLLNRPLDIVPLIPPNILKEGEGGRKGGLGEERVSMGKREVWWSQKGDNRTVKIQKFAN